MKSTEPGALLSLLVRFLVPAERREEFLGDLLEEAAQRRRQKPARAVRTWLLGQVVLSAPWLIWMRVAGPKKVATLAPSAAPAVEMSGEEMTRAFSAFLAGQRDERRRRMPVVVSVAVHATLLTIAAVAPWWNVDELDPPPVMIRSQIWIPPPIPVNSPTSGPTASGEAGAKRPEVKPAASKPRPRTAEPLPTQPIASRPPAEEPTPRSTSSDGAQGEKGLTTVVGPNGLGDRGTGSGESGPPGSQGGPGTWGNGAPLGPNVGEKQCLRCPDPHLSPAMLRVMTRAQLLARICVRAAGDVLSVKVLQSIDAATDEGIVQTVRTWRFRPYFVNGHSVPFCYNVNFVFEAR